MKMFFNNTCVKCNGESGLNHLDKDHIIPLYQGGSNSITNIQPLCAKCNASKGSDNSDYRILYCRRHNLDVPIEYIPSYY